MEIIEIIISSAITGIGSGMGVAVGTYFAQKTILKQMEDFDKKIEAKKKEIKEKRMKKKKLLLGEMKKQKTERE